MSTSSSFPTWPPFDDDIRAALDAAYADGSWGRYDGPHGERLANRISELFSVSHAFLCSSGTFAVELALRVALLNDGDEVLLAGYDFAGNFRAIEECRLRPVLVDIDPDTWTLDATRLESAASERTRAVVVSHLHSGLAPMSDIRDLATRRGWHLVEDACQAPGAVVEGRPAGAWGDVGVFSFGGSKLLTAGRGGAIVTSNPTLLQRAKIACERGNHAFPLSELQAAVLLPQLNKLAKQNAIRQENAQRLHTALVDCDLLRPVRRWPRDSRPAYYKVSWLFNPDAFQGRCREQFIAAAQAAGAAVDVGFRGFARRGNRCRVAGDLTHSARAARDTVLLHHPTLLEPAEYMDRVVAALRDSFNAQPEAPAGR